MTVHSFFSVESPIVQRYRDKVLEQQQELVTGLIASVVRNTDIGEAKYIAGQLQGLVTALEILNDLGKQQERTSWREPN